MKAAPNHKALPYFTLGMMFSGWYAVIYIHNEEKENTVGHLISTELLGKCFGTDGTDIELFTAVYMV